jgi:hypothetical protein
MPRTSNRSASGLLDEIRSVVREEMRAALRPSIQRILSAASELESALGGSAGPGRRGRRRGRPPGSTSAAAPKARRGRRRRGKRAPRGAMKAAVHQILSNSPTPLKISEVRDRLLASADFSGRNPKTLYAQIVHTLQRSSEAKRTGDGRYGISRRGGGGRRGRRKAADASE